MTEPIHHRVCGGIPFRLSIGPIKKEPGCAQFRHWCLRIKYSITPPGLLRKGRVGGRGREEASRIGTGRPGPLAGGSVVG